MLRLLPLVMLASLACTDSPQRQVADPVIQPVECECALGDACVDGACVGPADRRGCVGNRYGCAIHEGDVWCWGYGPETARDRGPGEYGPMPVEGVSSVVELACSSHVCALHTDGGVTCWGANGYGQAGQPETDFVYSNEPPVRPSRVAGLTGVAAISVAAARTCARFESGGVACWGQDVDQPRGYRATESQHTPRPTLGLDDTIELITLRSQSCAVRRGGSVVCWGGGELRPIPGLRGVVELAATRTSACARLDDGTVSCWQGTESPQSTWNLNDARSITVTGSGTLCARRANGQAWCWGSNHYGQIGNDSREARPSPTRVRSLAELQPLTGSGELSCAMRDAELHCWGRNNGRILGLGEVHRLPKHVYTIGADEQPAVTREMPPPVTAPVAPPITAPVATAATDDEPHWHCLCYRELAEGVEATHTACRGDLTHCEALERRASRMQRGFTALDVACRDIGAAEHPSSLVSAMWEPSARPGAYWVQGECVLE